MSVKLIGTYADAAYQAIRADASDAALIAANTGLKLTNIQTIKDHLFTTPHILDKYVSYGVPEEYRVFDSDMRIAQAWRRLQTPGFPPEDRKLLYHEMAEAWYMRRHGHKYSAAHEGAQKRFPSPLIG